MILILMKIINENTLTSFNNKDSFTPSTNNIIFKNYSINTLRSSKSNISFDVFTNFILLDESIRRFN
jgi:hypothetical protein